ncbi:CMD domain protein [Streptosporangium album]|uniref:CMD domain protein n=1 Tax=Streptosporangium album TaxID=47479 RepID=A0A7W7WEG7_9ACTN|nr:CMD domain protein [Streptosporangium album]MBB4943440.1 CMD domain protein [Streptosporangium album]
MSTDIINRLAGIEPGSRIDHLRDRRPAARENAQRSYRALFSPESPGEVAQAERHAVAAFVTGLHQDAVVARFYADRLAELSAELPAAVAREVEAARTTGPYGAYPAGGPLASESVEGLVYRVRDRDTLGDRLSAALEHAHLLVFRPRESSPEALRRLIDAGWTTSGIVTLSQLVAFLSFQVRVIAGLRLLDTIQKGARS